MRVMGFEDAVRRVQEQEAEERKRTSEPEPVPPLPVWHSTLVDELVKYNIRKVQIFSLERSSRKKTFRYNGHTTNWYSRVGEAWVIALSQHEEGGTMTYPFQITPQTLTTSTWVIARTSAGVEFKHVTHGLPRGGGFCVGSPVLPDDPAATSMAISAVASLRSNGSRWRASESGTYTVHGQAR